MKNIIFLFVLSPFISGCASDVANRYYGSTTYPKKSISDVAILYNRPTREFITIADFQSRGETAEDLQSKAAEIGADAVIVSFLGGKYNERDQWAGKDSESNTYSHIVGTAIKYK